MSILIGKIFCFLFKRFSLMDKGKKIPFWKYRCFLHEDKVPVCL